MAKTRVALFFTTLHKGGSEAQALLLAEHADKKKFELLAYALQGGPLEEKLKALGIQVRILNASPWKLLSAIRTLRRYLKEDRIDVLHCLLWHPNMVGRLACRGTGVRCINSVRWAERKYPRDLLDYATRPLVDAWIANGNYGAYMARLPKKKTTIIYNGVSDKLLKTPLSAWKPRPKTAIMVGQFRREKQHKELIEAALMLPDWRFTLVGDGPLFTKTKDYAKRVGARNVEFLGHRSDAQQLLLKHEVSLLLSKSEGNPNVTIESLALGVPFIGSDIPPQEELLAGGRGIIIRTTPKSIVSAIQRIHTMDKKAKDKMRSAGKEYVRKTYDTAQMVKKTQALWQ